MRKVLIAVGAGIGLATFLGCGFVLWALDTYKAEPIAEASALNAQKVAARLQLSPERRSRLILLVDHHLTLSEMAQRRNVEDPATVAAFARSPDDGLIVTIGTLRTVSQCRM